jgi:hypothetical protein
VPFLKSLALTIRAKLRAHETKSISYGAYIMIFLFVSDKGNFYSILTALALPNLTIRAPQYDGETEKGDAIPDQSAVRQAVVGGQVDAELR